ncbi:MAG: hypothetical protein DMF90_18610, partial [Acidobacteria bacterium]
LDGRQEKIGYKIREAQLQKIPYMLVVGDREQDRAEVAVRARADGDIGVWKLTDDDGGGFISSARQEIDSKGSQTVKELAAERN